MKGSGSSTKEIPLFRAVDPDTPQSDFLLSGIIGNTPGWTSCGHFVLWDPTAISFSAIFENLVSKRAISDSIS